jgi:serine protease Do
MMNRFLFSVIIGLSLIPVAPTAMAERTVPNSTKQIQLSYAPVVKNVTPAVVNIYAQRLTPGRTSLFANDPIFQFFFGRDAFGPRVENSLGSGVIVRPDGYVITNRHVVENARDIRIVLSDGREYDAVIMVEDDKSDLALLRVLNTNGNLPHVDLGDSDDLMVGDIILAIGNPFGVGQTVTNGIISALSRTADIDTRYRYFIQTDAAINPGNSGGALVDINGRLVGINTAIYSGSGGSHGIGFATPANLVKTVVNSIDRDGNIIRPWPSMGLRSVSPEIADAIGLNRPIGALVNDVYPGGAADQAGIRAGDVITAINNTLVEGPYAVDYHFATADIGERLSLTIRSTDGQKRVDVTARAPSTTPSASPVKLDGRHPMRGLVVSNINPSVIYDLNLPMHSDGVVIRTGGNGLKSGDIIAKINGQEIDNVDELQSALSSADNRWQITIKRDGRMISSNVQWR